MCVTLLKNSNLARVTDCDLQLLELDTDSLEGGMGAMLEQAGDNAAFVTMAGCIKEIIARKNKVRLVPGLSQPARRR